MSRTPSSAAPARLRLVTYNIHKGIGGLDRRYRPERVAEVLAHCDADLVFLQEVADGMPRSRLHRQVDLLAEALGFQHRSYCPNVELRRGRYGNAILSRFPLRQQENIDLTLPMKKRRGALHARVTLEVAGRHLRLWLFNVHLGLAEFERRWQLRRLLQWQHRHRMQRGTSVIVAGDFNDVWGKLGPLVLEPEGYHGTNRKILTFPAARPLRPLDRVFVCGSLRVRYSYRSRIKLARYASDHLPLVAELGPEDS